MATLLDSLGRPRHKYQPRAEAASTPATVRLSPKERERILEAAKLNRQSVSDFTRTALLTAAEECLE